MPWHSQKLSLERCSSALSGKVPLPRRLDFFGALARNLNNTLSSNLPTRAGGNTRKRLQNECPRTGGVEPVQENHHMGGVRIGDMQLAAKYLSIAPWAVGNGGVLSLTFFTFSFHANMRI